MFSTMQSQFRKERLLTVHILLAEENLHKPIITHSLATGYTRIFPTQISTNVSR